MNKKIEAMMLKTALEINKVATNELIEAIDAEMDNAAIDAEVEKASDDTPERIANFQKAVTRALDELNLYADGLYQETTKVSTVHRTQKPAQRVSKAPRTKAASPAGTA